MTTANVTGMKGMLLAGLLLGCGNPTDPLGEGPLALERFDFATPITTLYPAKYRSKEFAATYYNVPSRHSPRKSFLTAVDTITARNAETGAARPVAIMYKPLGSSSGDELATLGPQSFSRVTVVTDLQNRVQALAAATTTTAADSKAFIAHLTSIYGPATIKQSTYCGGFTLYEWSRPDRVLRYGALPDNGRTTLQLTRNQAGQTAVGPGHARLEAYLYVIKKNFVTQLDPLKTADFSYCTP